MLKAVIFGLEGVLLADGGEIIPRMLRLLGSRLTSSAGSDETASALWKAGRAVSENDGSVSCEDRFWSVLAEQLGGRIQLERVAAEELIKSELPALAAGAHPIPYAEQMLSGLRMFGVKTALAPDPMLSETAVRLCLEGAGLKADGFSLIAHSGNTRFGKRRSEYYTELARMLDVPPGDCLAVGDESDLAAETAGMRLFRYDKNGGFMLLEYITDLLVQERGEPK